jgi:phospholipid transport system substrate-binding protein
MAHIRWTGRLCTVAVLVTGVVLGAAASAWAGRPTDELRRYTDKVLEVLQAPGLSPAQRRAQVRDVATEVFDVAETARRALGPHWQQRTPAEREEFVRLFRDLLEQTYVTRIEEYGGERVEYLSERVDGDTSVVRAQIVTRDGKTVPVEGRLLQKNGRWYVYDILIENVSLVANYRSQFDRIIRTSSYDELVKRLRDRVASAAESKPAGAGRASGVR